MQSCLPPRCATRRLSWPLLRLGEDQGWTLARTAELVRRRFRADHTLAGPDEWKRSLANTVLASPTASPRDRHRAHALL